MYNDATRCGIPHGHRGGRFTGMKRLLDSSISRKLLGSFFLILIPIVAINLYMNQYSLKELKSRVNDSYGQSLLLLSTQFESGLRKYESLAYALSVDDDIIAMNQAPDKMEVIWQYGDLLKQLKFFANTNELEGEIVVVAPAKKRMFTSSGFVWDLNQYPYVMEGHRQREANSGWYFGIRKQPVFEEKTTLSFSRINEGVYVAVDIPLDHVERLLTHLASGKEMDIVLLGKDDPIVISTRGAMPAEEEQELRGRIEEQNQASGDFSMNLSGEQHRVIYASSEHSGLTIGIYFPEKKFMAPILQLRNWMYGIAAGVVILMLIYTWMSYRGILAPINQLVDAMRTASMGQFNVEIPVRGKNEFTFMFIQFNRMVSKISALINEVYLAKLKQQQVQLKLLQSQINPHFLYNSLNMIYQMAMGNNNEGVASMSLYLSKYFRYATKTHRDLVTLQSELENIRNYIEILKIQYDNKIIDNIDVPEELLSIAVPRLSVQPIVENAIVHGIEQDEGGSNRLWITARKDDNSIKLTIENDGIDIDPSEIEIICASLDNFNEEGSGDGLNNTHWRLRLRYGEEAGLAIAAREGGGARVTLTLPLQAQTREETHHV